MRRKDLEIFLQRVQPIAEPRPELEQYSTPATLASMVLHLAFMNGDIEDKRVADLGCGSGIFAIGAAKLGAKSVTAIDIDNKMITQTHKNIELLGIDPDIIELKVADIATIKNTGNSEETKKIKIDQNSESKFDTILQNPPFGSQNPGADTPFLETALELSDKVYSFHMASTLDFLRKKIDELGGSIDQENRAFFPIPHMFKFHTKAVKEVEVVVLTISRQ